MTVTLAHLGPPLDLLGRFGAQRQGFVRVLRALRTSDWSRPTLCEGWDVADVVAHVVGDDLSRLARSRDGWARVAPVTGEPLPSFVDRINDEWVVAARRCSPRL